LARQDSRLKNSTHHVFLKDYTRRVRSCALYLPVVGSLNFETLLSLGKSSVASVEKPWEPVSK